MGSAFVETTSVRIEHDEDWVEIKPKLGLGDRARFSSAVYEIGQQADTDGGVKFGINVGKVARLMLKLSIVRWSFDVAVTEKNVDRIDMDHPLWGKVLGAIQERNPTLMELLTLGESGPES